MSVKQIERDEKKERVIACLRAGLTLSDAAREAKTTDRSILNWRNEDPDYSRRVDEARREGKRARVMVARDVMFKAAKKGNLKAAQYIIEHDDPDVEPTPAPGPGFGSFNVSVNVGTLSDDDLARIAARGGAGVVETEERPALPG